MIRARGGELKPWLAASLPANDDTLRELLGASRPKLRLVRRVQLAPTAEEGRRLFAASPDPISTTVLWADTLQVAVSPPPGGPEPSGTVEVQRFSANRIEVRTVVEGKEPAWLIYADAWNPGWRATVDGHAVAILHANVGFKAVPIESGVHDVCLQYAPPRRTWVAWCFGLIEMLFGAALCALCRPRSFANCGGGELSRSPPALPRNSTSTILAAPPGCVSSFSSTSTLAAGIGISCWRWAAFSKPGP